ncbi:MAG: ATP phosphoribosyltransferase regulatory subunit [Solirubrobacterales bacterium]|nr:ATP phosphoribosyltransferase regulatory subunit [Solirubrobacterales bacterium]
MSTQPLPTGTRDVLAEEMRELRAIETSLLALFGARGYEEVATPTIEYQDAFARGAGPEGTATYRFLDESGSVLALRNDMTVPIARLVARRFAGAPGPFRLAYSGSVYRRVRPQRGQLREMRQIGVELIGAEAPAGTAELVELLVASLDAIGLQRAVIGLGDADLFPSLLGELGVNGPAADRILERLADHDLVAIEDEAGDLAELGEAERATIVALSNLRGGPEVLDRARALGGPAIERASATLAETLETLAAAGVADRVQVDFGLLRDLGYYTGAILEVYDPAVGEAIGGGGRYDDLLGRFGSPRPAAGFALYLERLHVAQAAEQELGRP